MLTVSTMMEDLKRMRLDLACLATEGRMIPNAPVEALRSTTIEAPAATVWALLIDVQNWPRWHVHLAGARIDGPFAVGSKLTYGGMIKHRLAIADVEHARRAMIYGTLGGYVGITRWTSSQWDPEGRRSRSPNPRPDP
jgi:hypothetical protein